MAIDSHYIPAFSIEDVLLDKDKGAPLSGGLVYFEQDNNRGVLKPVYQITGTSPNYTYTQLPNPVELSSIGTFEDSLSNPTIPYFYPFDANGDPEYYFVRVTSSTDVPQFSREAVPYIPTDISPAESAINFGNEITNPQFAEVLFDTDSANYVYSFTAATLEAVEIAPGWEIVASGTGTVTVSQSRPVGSLNRPTNPGTLLNINSTGVSYLRLRQRIYGSPNLFGQEFISGFFVAKTFGASSATVTMYYSQSNGTVTNIPVLAAILPATGAYTEFSGSTATAIPASTSADSFPDGYIDIELAIPLSTNIEITSIQVVGTGAVSVSDVPYDAETNYRQIDHEFHYYQPLINFKPIPSMLSGWDFPLNPAQINSSSFTMSTTAAYIWDQTIGKSVVGNIAVVRNAVTSGIQATIGNADEAFYYMQYLSGDQARKILGTRLSVNVNAFRTQAGGACTARVYLYRGNAASSFPTLPTSLGTIAASGVFTLTAANWTLITRSNLGQAQGTLPVVNTADYTTLNDDIDLQFNGWEITDTAEIADTDKFAIVVTFQCPTTATVVTVNSISLVPGDIPTRPAPQTKDEVIRECQYYYETSKDVGVAITTSDSNGALLRRQDIFTVTVPPDALELWPRSFGIEYNTVKRVAPTVSIYNEGGTAANVSGFTFQAGVQHATSSIAITNWTARAGGQKGIEYISNYTNTASGFLAVAGVVNNTSEAFISFHFQADARLGVV